ncbi:aminoglycoside phosphotransferase family protein [Streptomyces albidoflavus]|uniref:aminoglycoside phosphotransferase family protein n=1 Tax=Streptomyces albidoflavus TaxID=1886 RepID=UPI0033D734C6
MLVRLPTGPEYALAVEKEHRWLPVLAPAVPLDVPVPRARGVPGPGFPHHWSVYRWIEGETATEPPSRTRRRSPSVSQGSSSLCNGSTRPADRAPAPTTGFGGGPLTTYDGWTRAALETLDGLILTGAAEELWERAAQAPWDGGPAWFHGDMAAGDLLVKDGTLTAVIDFGTCGVGDPACDLSIAWTLLTGRGRAAFRDRLEVDEATWRRGQGWALRKALVVCAGAVRDGDGLPADASFVLEEILAAH